MPNQRKPGIARISVTLPNELLERIEEEAERRAATQIGFDRLAFIREAILEKLKGDVPWQDAPRDKDALN